MRLIILFGAQSFLSIVLLRKKVYITPGENVEYISINEAR